MISRVSSYTAYMQTARFEVIASAYMLLSGLSCWWRCLLRDLIAIIVLASSGLLHAHGSTKVWTRTWGSSYARYRRCAQLPYDDDRARDCRYVGSSCRYPKVARLGDVQ